MYVEMLSMAIVEYLLKSDRRCDTFPHAVNEHVQAGMMERFACRSFDFGVRQHDERSHSYLWWCEGWHSMDRAIKVSIAKRSASRQLPLQADR